MLRVGAVLLALVGCGRFRFDSLDSSGDARAPDASRLPTCASGCAATEFCASPPFSCGGTPSCVTTPTSCSPTSDPVCGCDGTTYVNACEANRVGVSVSLAGACPAIANPTCTPACGSDQFCATPDGACNSQQGLCMPKPAPSDCDIPFAVCGCDGVTYLSPCEAAIAGASLLGPGTCAT